MEPTIPSGGPNPEQAPQPEPASPEAEPSVAPEQAPRPEREPQPQPSGDRGISLPPVQVSPPAPAADAAAVTPAVDPAAADDTPAVADDVDVIEKEWVNRAKKVIEQTKNDPHAQEEGFERLQVEYQQKRYGRDIKMP